MASSYIDTNVIIRYLVEDPDTIPAKFKGVYPFFRKIEKGEVQTQLAELVLFECFFVLTRIYDIPQKQAASILQKLISMKGFILPDKKRMQNCFELLTHKTIDLVDAYLVTASNEKGLEGVFSWDKDLSKTGLKLLEIK